MPLTIMPTPRGQKHCGHCDYVLPVGAFNKNRAKGDGLSYDCTLCHRVLRRRSQAIHRAARMVVHHRRRALKRQAPGTHTAHQWRRLKARYGNRCLACGVAEPVVQLTRDHVRPLGPDGPNSIDNLQPLCGACNVRKGQTYREFRPERLLSA